MKETNEKQIIIFILEDDFYLRRDIGALLRQEGFAVREAASLAEAGYRASENPEADLYLVDVWLPDGDGFAFLEKLRKKTSAPVLFLTACDDEPSVVRGLELGADDYITKPFRRAELVSRIRANLRRMQGSSGSGALRAGELELDMDTHEARLKGRPISLRPAEYRLLLAFMENRGRLLNRNSLLSLLDTDLAGGAAEDNTLSVHISRLRAKIGGRYIETVRGFGYRFSPPL